MVISRREEKQILKDGKRLRVSMAPKEAAVLIDDDALVHMTWKVAARSAGVALKQFRNPADFFANYEELSKDTTIYIDSDLGDGLKGEEIARILHATGFKTIYLETGHQPGSFPNMPWIKQVIGKDPPWAG